MQILLRFLLGGTACLNTFYVLSLGNNFSCNCCLFLFYQSPTIYFLPIFFRAAGGGMVDPDPEIQNQIEKESSRLKKMYGGGDLSAFPDVKFNGMYV